MAGSGPTVTATIVANDLATPVIAKVGAAAQHIAAESTKHASAIGTAHEVAMLKAGAHVNNAVDDMRLKIRSATADAALAFGGMALGAAHAAIRVGESMSEVERRIRSFTSATGEQIEMYRKWADTSGSVFKGGPEAALEGIRVAATSGVAPAAAPAAAKVGAIYAAEAGEDLGRGTGHLLLHSLVGGDIRDDGGNVIPISQATAEQITRGMTMASDLLQAQNRLSPGSLPSIYEMSKVAFPVTRSQGVSNEVTFAIAQELAEKGIEGSHAGEVIRSLYGSAVRPTAKARSAIAEAGVDYGAFAQIDTSGLDPADVMKGIELRTGSLNDGSRKLISATLDHFKATKDFDASQKELTDALVATGSKSMKNRTAASNLANDMLGAFVKSIDLPGLLADLKAKNAAIGTYNTLFGRDMGGPATLIDGSAIAARVGRIEAEEAKHPTDIAQREMAESYTGAKQRMSGAYEGLLDQLFLSQESHLKTLYNTSADVLGAISGAPKALQEWGGELAAISGVVTGSKVLSGMAEFGSHMASIAGGAEGAAAGLGRIAGALGLLGRFTPAAAAITGYDIAKAAIPILAGVGEIAKGTYYTPQDEQDFSALKDQRDVQAAELAAMKARRFDPAEHAPGVMAARQAIGRALADSPNEPDNDEIRAARVERARITADPNYGDSGLAEMRARYDEMNRTSQEIVAAGGQLSGSMVHDLGTTVNAITKRMADNAEQQAARIEAANQKFYDALGKAAAVPNEPGSLAPLRTNLEAAQAQAREGYVAPFDPVMQQKEDALRDLNNRLQSYELKRERMPTIGANGFLEHGAEVHGRRVDVGLGFDRLPVQPLHIGPVDDPRPGFGGLGVQRVETGSQKPVDVKVTGQAEVLQHFELQVQPTPYFTGLIKRVENVAKMALGQGDDLAGSNAARKPSAPAVWHGPH